jgi:hypothetical protein
MKYIGAKKVNPADSIRPEDASLVYLEDDCDGSQEVMLYYPMILLLSSVIRQVVADPAS